MKRFLPSKLSTDSLLALNIASKYLCASCLRSWLTGLTMRTYICNNVQLWRFAPANAQKTKSANSLHLQMEQLLEYVSITLGETKEHIKLLLSK